MGLRLLAVASALAASAALRDPWWLGAGLLAMLAFALCARVPVRSLLRRLIPLTPVMGSMVLVHGWANPANQTWVGIFGIEGLTFGVTTALRLACFVTAANLFLLATETRDIVRWTRRRNRDLGVMVSMALTVAPVLSEQMRVTLIAQQARGMPVGPSLGLKLKAYVQVLIPVVVKALTRAEQMTLLLLARGYERVDDRDLPDAGASLVGRQFGFAYPGAPSWALARIDLSLDPGEIGLVLGGSGSGKSTLLACIGGDPPETPKGFVTGEMLVGGIADVTNRPFVSMTVQNPGVHLFETPLAEVSFPLECRGMRHDVADTTALEMLREAGVADLAQRPLRTLSGGERQRVALAAALATDPAVLLLDEPFEQLDEEGARDLLPRLRALAADGRGVLVASRHSDLAAALGARVIGLTDGRTVEPSAMEACLPAPPRAPVIAGALALEIDAVTYRYEEGGGIEAVTLEVREGEAVAILGPNGAGKSTLLRVGLGLLAPQCGTVRLMGDDPAALGPGATAERAAILFQDPDDQIFNPRVDTEIGWALRVRGVSADCVEQRVTSALEELGLSDVRDRHPYELSRSVRQLVALASVLVGEPRVLFLDEPTTSLDARAAAIVLAAVERRRAKGTAVLVVTHDAAVASGWADRAVRLEAGRIARS
ncbi:MAG: ATP-binding cassette domain-containing protein [Coriobacteriia bacterium]|nr:ATP-binding cassette domain-containing protein [Coriobacteriia bacterium]